MSQNEYALLNEQISGLTRLLNARLENIDDKLEQIHTEAKRTNGRVTKTEQQIHEALVERAGNREQQRQYTKIVEDNCVELTKIKNSLQEYHMILKYPKLFIASVILLVFLSLASFFDKEKIVEKIFPTEPVKIEIPK